jgi:thiamine pyrophosphate-dependent acetolactate synthase large subunit-like protein
MMMMMMQFCSRSTTTLARVKNKNNNRERNEHIVAGGTSSGGTSNNDNNNKIKSKEDLYFILGVSVGASQEAVKRAYKTKAKRYHPDINPSSAELFLEIKAAYETLQANTGNLQNVQTREWRKKWKEQLQNLRKEREKKLTEEEEIKAIDCDDDEEEESLVGTVEMQQQISNQLKNRLENEPENKCFKSPRLKNRLRYQRSYGIMKYNKIDK